MNNITMKKYIGVRTPNGGCVVTVVVGDVSRPLDPRFDLRNHSPTGFEYGHTGSGPAQLALAILADAVGDEKAQRYYHDFKFAVVNKWSGDEFIISADEIVCFLDSSHS